MIQRYNIGRLRLVGDDYTIDTPSQERDADELCDFCGVRDDCAARRGIDKVQLMYGAGTSVRRCPLFTPVLRFRSVLGIAGDFNAFRLGASWWSRLKIGGRVACAHAGGGIFAMATILFLESGKLDDMLARYAAGHHVNQGRAIDDPQAGVRRDLAAAYGRNFASLRRPITVIGLRRIDDVEAAQG